MYMIEGKTYSSDSAHVDAEVLGRVADFAAVGCRRCVHGIYKINAVREAVVAEAVHGRVKARARLGRGRRLDAEVDGHVAVVGVGVVDDDGALNLLGGHGVRRRPFHALPNAVDASATPVTGLPLHILYVARSLVVALLPALTIAIATDDTRVLSVTLGDGS
jgi:hypothetical protein